jgi:hypothetical protein
MYLCVPVDIMLVSRVDQEQVFEEEESQCLSKDGTWTSLPTYSIFVPHNLHDN